MGFIMESPTWRASRDWGRQIGYDSDALEAINHQCIDLLSQIRQQQETQTTPMVISGCIGPRSDGYTVAEKMTANQAQQYHREQIATLSRTEADLGDGVHAETMPRKPSALPAPPSPWPCR